MGDRRISDSEDVSVGINVTGCALPIFLYKCFCIVFFFFKQKTAYEIKECDWSSDVCSSDLHTGFDMHLKLPTHLTLSSISLLLYAVTKMIGIYFISIILLAVSIPSNEPHRPMSIRIKSGFFSFKCCKDRKSVV